jgi:parallel beta-helix repeat protein
MAALAIAPLLAYSQVVLSPGDDIQQAVDQNSPGTTFVLNSGLYRLQSIQPQDGDTFLGQGPTGAILSGAQLLTNFTQAGALWVASNQNQQGQTNGSCDAQHPMCATPEDLFFDDTPLLHVGDISQVAPGTWYFDYANHLIYFADNPTGHKVETSVARSAFWGPASNVTIQYLTIEKYAVPAQFGAIGDQYPGPNWTIQNNEIRWNHGVGINLGSGSQALNNYIHHNGQKGIGGDGANMLVQGNDISFNNWAGFDPTWEAGGGKFAQMSMLTLRGNSVHDNAGPGLWCDVDCIGVLIENNTVVNNSGGAGIQYEISYMGTIRNNVVRGNFDGTSGWLWGSQILIQNSRDTAVYGNTVEVIDKGNGIGIIQQDRGTGAYGPRIAANNYVYSNSITHRMSPQGANGEVADYNSQSLLATQNNVFDYNSYHVTDPSALHWFWGGPQNWDGMHAMGQELNGTLDTNLPPQ